MTRATQPSSLGLRQVDLLQGLSTERLDAIGRQCAWRPLRGRPAAGSARGPDRDVHFIVAGRVRVTTYSPGGRETSFRELRAGRRSVSSPRSTAVRVRPTWWRSRPA